MAEILLFHHAQGEAPGFLAFADELRAAGHTVHAPDLYEGKTFATLDEGVGYAKQVGFDPIGERCRLAAESLPNELVFPGLRVRRLVAAGSSAPDPHDGGRRVGDRGPPRRARAR